MSIKASTPGTGYGLRAKVFISPTSWFIWPRLLIVSAHSTRKLYFDKTIATKPPTMNYQKVMDSDEGVKEWTGNIVSSLTRYASCAYAIAAEMGALLR